MSFRPTLLLRTILRTRAAPRLQSVTAPTRFFFSSTPFRQHEHIPADPTTALTAPSNPKAAPTTVPATPSKQIEKKHDYNFWFTCRPCQERSPHVISKQAYHYGSVLVKCPGCQIQHVLTDHLELFSMAKKQTPEVILKENSELLKQARVLENGDMELLPEGVEDKLKVKLE